jgi:nucleoside-diphosphate-sugar epimerase
MPGFDVVRINFTGKITDWGRYLAKWLSCLSDENIIFSLDDYLIADHLNREVYESALKEMGGEVVCVKLCHSTEEEHKEYPVTTQYCIWNREYLIWLLAQGNRPWDFEFNGATIFNKEVLLRPCLEYFTNSAISGQWNGVRLDGLKQEDIDYIKEKKLIREKRIVVFGGSGFLGTALIGALAFHSSGNKLYGNKIIAVARNEGALVELKQKYPDIEIIVGDISDRWIVEKAMKDADEVYLLAALKHVGLAETEVKSCVNTNITGCMNIISKSLIVKPKLFLFVSTDKASQPRGVYGCSKKIGERLIAEAEKINPDTKYRIVRYGNIWDSTGSISTKWKPKMQNGEEIILTDPEASRFFWTVKEAIDLIFECVGRAKDSAPYIPKMKAVTMGVVLDACMEVYGKCPVKIIGLQPGENKVETIDGITFSDAVEQFTKSEFIQKFLK